MEGRLIANETCFGSESGWQSFNAWQLMIQAQCFGRLREKRIVKIQSPIVKGCKQSLLLWDRLPFVLASLGLRSSLCELRCTHPLKKTAALTLGVIENMEDPGLG